LDRRIDVIRQIRNYATATTLLLIIVATPASAASTMTEVTRANPDSQPFIFEVMAEDKEDGMIWYRVVVTPRRERDTWCVSAAARIVKDEETVGSFELAERHQTDDGGSWTFAFSVSRTYVDDSRFTFFDGECEMPAFDGYWFNLKEFYR
jgi:hypothetical protein